MFSITPPEAELPPRGAYGYHNPRAASPPAGEGYGYRNPRDIPTVRSLSRPTRNRQIQIAFFDFFIKSIDSIQFL